MIKIAMFRPEDKDTVYKAEGVEITNIPVTKVVDTDINILHFLEKVGNVDYIVFTSTLAVQKFKKALEYQFDKYLKKCKEVIAVGNETAKSINLKKVVIPVIKSTAGIADYLKLKSGTVLLVRSKQGNPDLVCELRTHMTVYVLDIYTSEQLVPDQRHFDFSKEIVNRIVDALIFTSAMITTSFYNIFSELDPKLIEHLSAVFKVAIGEETADTMRSLNLVADHILSEPDILNAITFIKMNIQNEQSK